MGKSDCRKCGCSGAEKFGFYKKAGKKAKQFGKDLNIFRRRY